MIGQQNVNPMELLAERYLLQEEIGKGWMSTVYLAQDQAAHDAPVAVKVLNTDHPDEIKQELFSRETAALKRLNKPNIILLQQIGFWARRPILPCPGLSALPQERPGTDRVENGSIVRQFTGHHRYSGKTAGQAMAQLFKAGRLLVNYLQPSQHAGEPPRRSQGH